MSIVKITIKINQRNPALVKLKVNIKPATPKHTENPEITNQSSIPELPEDIPAGGPEDQQIIQHKTKNRWFKISSWLHSHRDKKS